MKKPKRSILRWCLFHSGDGMLPWSMMNKDESRKQVAERCSHIIGEHVKIVRVRCTVVPRKRRAKK